MNYVLTEAWVASNGHINIAPATFYEGLDDIALKVLELNMKDGNVSNALADTAELIDELESSGVITMPILEKDYRIERIQK